MSKYLLVTNITHTGLLTINTLHITHAVLWKPSTHEDPRLTHICHDGL